MRTTRTRESLKLRELRATETQELETYHVKLGHPEFPGVSNINHFPLNILFIDFHSASPKPGNMGRSLKRPHSTMSHCGEALHLRNYRSPKCNQLSNSVFVISQTNLAFPLSFLEMYMFDLRGYLAAIVTLIVEVNCSSYLCSCVSLLRLCYVVPSYTCTDLDMSQNSLQKLKSPDTFNKT